MTFDELVKKCREQGILQYDGACEGDRLRITFAPEAMFPVDKEVVASLDKQAETAKPEKRRGADGLTADEQFDTYGVVIDAEI